MILEENGFKVDTFTDPLLALQNFKEQDGMYDMIILDIKMPEMNGFELCRQIKKIDDNIKVCFLTAAEFTSHHLEAHVGDDLRMRVVGDRFGAREQIRKALARTPMESLPASERQWDYLLQIAEELTAPLEPYALDKARVAHRQNYPIAANWKLKTASSVAP